MDQQQLLNILNRIATALERQAFALCELVVLKDDEIFEAAGGTWYVTPEGEKWQADRIRIGRSAYPVPRQFLTKEAPASDGSIL